MIILRPALIQNEKIVKVQIIKGVVGKPHFLAYSVGQIADIPDEKAEALIKGGFAKAYNRGEKDRPTPNVFEKATSKKVKRLTKR